MNKLFASLAAVALLGAGSAAMADEPVLPSSQKTVLVNVTVEKFVEVNRDSATASLTLLGPAAGRVKDKNWFQVGLTVKSNCSVDLDVAEGLTQVLLNAGIPADGLWGPQYTAPTAIFTPGLNLYSVNRTAAATDFNGAVFGYGHNVWSAVPGGPANAQHVAQTLLYGQVSPGQDGPSDGAYTYTGTMHTFVGLGCDAHEGTTGGKNWTSIPAGSLPSFNLYATVSAK